MNRPRGGVTHQDRVAFRQLITKVTAWEGAVTIVVSVIMAALGLTTVRAAVMLSLILLWVIAVILGGLVFEELSDHDR